MLEIDNFVEVPIINAFSDYERVMNELVQIGVNKNNIYILCCSMMSCLICRDLKEINQKYKLQFQLKHQGNQNNLIGI